MKIQNIIKKISNKLQKKPKEILQILQTLNIKIKNIDTMQKLEKKIKYYINKSIITKDPIITIMGHSNHGKTSLLDYIRKSNITNKEYGKITQHINAYQIIYKKKNITFIDTPGHELFNIIRNIGAKFADIILLLIASNDGIMPQTIESIKIAQKFKIPIIVAISKIDKKNNVKSKIIKKELSEYGIISDKIGGNNLFTKISIKKKKSIDNLLNTILLQAEILELKTSINKNAKGIVLDTKIDKQKGIISNIILYKGILNVGDYVVSNNKIGKIKIIYNDKNKIIKQALPSMPIKILGFNNKPKPGYIIEKIKNIKKLKKNKKNTKIKKIIKNAYNVSNMYNIIKKSKNINIILKTDTEISLKIITKKINQMSKYYKINIKIIIQEIGSINQSDIQMSTSSKAIIISFNTKIDNKIKQLLLKYKIKYYNYNIIYDLLKKLKKQIKKTIYKNKDKKNLILGTAIIKKIFNFSKKQTIIGCHIKTGYMAINKKIIIKRENKIMYKGILKSIRIYTKKVKIAKKNSECGIKVFNTDKK